MPGFWNAKPRFGGSLDVEPSGSKYPDMKYVALIMIPHTEIRGTLYLGDFGPVGQGQLLSV